LAVGDDAHFSAAVINYSICPVRRGKRRRGKRRRGKRRLQEELATALTVLMMKIKKILKQRVPCMT